MSQLGKFRDALALYRRHGWTLARALMTADTLAALRRESDDAPDSNDERGADDASDADDADGARGVDDERAARFEGADVREAAFDAMWLRRPSAGGREAWELRLVADTPYALFELFEPDEAEEDREDVRREMEARLGDYVGGTGEGG
jgi:hypothetical protein